MHRLFAPFLAMAVLLAVLAPVPGHAADADNKGIKLEFDAAVLQRMSAFVSAFSEIDPQGRWHQIDDAAQADPKWLVTFGVLHNWMHNAAAFAVDNGSASIDAAVVAATIEEYTGLKFDSHATVPETGISFADGKYAIAADTPKEGPQAVVTNVYVTPGNELIMCGYVADKSAAEGAQAGHDDLQARVAHHTWQGKNGWKLLSWSWAGKPEAKPTGQVTEQPVEQPREQVVEQPAKAPVAQPAEHPAEQGTEQSAEQPKVESAAPAGQSETENALSEQEQAPAVVPAPADNPAEAPNVKPEPEALPAPENQPAVEQPAVQSTEEQPAPESAPANPTETEDTPAITPAPQPATEPVVESAPIAAVEPATPEESAEVAAPDVPQATAQPETVIPFTASTEPDFSEVLAIAVPMGWNHRNAEGMLELTPEAQDAWLVVEAVRLGARDPQKALKLFSGGAVLTPYGTSGASYMFTSEGRSGHREHMIVVDADANLICRLTWQASDVHKEAITAILHGLRVKGRAVAG